jgi:hypothetical protein
MFGMLDIQKFQSIQYANTIHFFKYINYINQSHFLDQRQNTVNLFNDGYKSLVQTVILKIRNRM